MDDRESLTFRPLRFWHGLQGLALSMVLLVASALALSLLIPEQVAADLRRWDVIALQLLAVQVCFTAAAVIVLRTRRVPLRTEGLWTTARPVVVIPAALGVLPAGILCDQAVSVLHGLNPTLFSTQSLGDMAARISVASPSGFIALCAVIAMTPAIGEELLFRGLVLRSFQADMPGYFAVIYSSILFGAVHMDWAQGTSAALLGIYLAFAAMMTGSLLSAAIAHALNNLAWCLFARFDADSVQRVVATGWDPLVVAVAGVLTAAAVVGVLFLRRKSDYSS